MEGDETLVVGHFGFIDGREGVGFFGVGARFVVGEVVNAEHNVLVNGEHGGAVSRLQEVFGGGHEFASLGLSGVRER